MQWFEYGGEHHRFRIILDFTDAKAPVDFAQILRTQRFYKRLSAHLDEIIVQMSAIVEIGIETTVYRYRQGLTGQYKAGTKPRRNTKGGMHSGRVEIFPEGDGYGVSATPTGTKPYRNIIAGLRDGIITVSDVSESFSHTTGATGKYKAGEKPHRNAGGGVMAGGMEISPESEGRGFHAPQSGTKPARNTTFTSLDEEFSAATAAEAFFYAVNQTGKSVSGTEPRRFAEGQENSGAFSPVITTETFYYRIRRCGTSRTKNG